MIASHLLSYLPQVQVVVDQLPPVPDPLGLIESLDLRATQTLYASGMYERCVVFVSLKSFVCAYFRWRAFDAFIVHKIVVASCLIALLIAHMC
jgi:hypothetical protein